MKRIFTIGLMTLTLLIQACGGDGEPEPVAPGKASLQFPENNTECFDGNILSDTQSEVTFNWSESINTSNYTLHVRNLDSEQMQTENSSSTSATVTLARGAAYSWYVVSKNSSGKTNQSDTWHFFNAGVGESSHSPFPAEAVNPTSGANIAAGRLDLQWKGNDLDGDLVAYEVYLDTQNPPQEQIGTPSNSTYNVEVESGNIYYWYVVSVDSKGNRSNSEVFEFKVN